MTEQELKDIWERWMHRNDLSADLDTVYLFATTTVAQRLLMTVDVDAILADASGAIMLEHAGLMYLHQLAQDDAQLARETTLFDRAAEAFSFWKSRTDRASVDPWSYPDAIT